MVSAKVGRDELPGTIFLFTCLVGGEGAGRRAVGPSFSVEVLEALFPISLRWFRRSDRAGGGGGSPGRGRSGRAFAFDEGVETKLDPELLEAMEDEAE